MINSKATNITIIAPTNDRLLYAKIRTFCYACLAWIGTYIAQWVDPMGLVYEPVFELFPCMLYAAGHSEPRHIMCLEVLGQCGIKRIRTELAKHGWQLDTFASDILFIGNGGAHCMTCPLLVT